MEDRRREEDVRGEGRNAFSKSTRGFLEGGGGGGGSKVKESEKRKEKEKQKSRKRER